ncbi:MAG: DUF4869 domain-containing protein [Lachnospiraceae bacterium]|nr:DUF4869 domain-containing protein [Lachnospiraceae bacterium]
MLKIYYGRDAKQVVIPVHFANNYEGSWLLDPLSKRMISEIDNSEVVSENLIISKVLGPIPPERLSGGVQGLILMSFDDIKDKYRWNGSQFGNNTLKFMLEIASLRDYDIRVSTMHYFDFPKDFVQDICIENDNTIVHDYKSFVDYYINHGIHIINTWDKEHPEFFNK